MKKSIFASLVLLALLAFTATGAQAHPVNPHHTHHVHHRYFAHGHWYDYDDDVVVSSPGLVIQFGF